MSEVPALDLESPPEESEFEVDLAKKTGLDGMLRHLQARLTRSARLSLASWS